MLHLQEFEEALDASLPLTDRAAAVSIRLSSVRAIAIAVHTVALGIITVCLREGAPRKLYSHFALIQATCQKTCQCTSVPHGTLHMVMQCDALPELIDREIWYLSYLA